MPRLSPEEWNQAQNITAMRVVDAVRDPLSDDTGRTRAFGDFLLCSLLGLSNDRLAVVTSKLDFENAKLGSFPSHDLRDHVNNSLSGLGISPEDALLVSTLADPRRVELVMTLRHIPEGEPVEGIQHGQKDQVLNVKEFIRGIVASEQVTIS